MFVQMKKDTYSSRSRRKIEEYKYGEKDPGPILMVITWSYLKRAYDKWKAPSQTPKFSF